MNAIDSAILMARVLATAHTDAGSLWQSLMLKIDVGMALARAEPAFLSRGWQGCTVQDSSHHAHVIEFVRYRFHVDGPEGGGFVMIGIPLTALAGAEAGVAALRVAYPPGYLDDDADPA